MASNNLKPASPVGGGDWRATLKADLRPKNVEKIMEALNRGLQFSGPEGLQELKIIVELFEGKMYAAATSESDYLHKTSLKTLLPKKDKSPISLPNSVLPDSAGTSSKPTDPGASPSMQTQVHNQGLSLPTLLPANQPQAQHQVLSPNLQSTTTGVQSAASSPSSLLYVSGINKTPVTVFGQEASMQNNMSNVAQNPADTTSKTQEVPSNTFSNPRNLQQLRQLPQLMRQQQQLQQNVKQSVPLQQAKRSNMQTSSVMPPSLMNSASTYSPPQNFPSSVQQSVTWLPPLLQQPQPMQQSQPGLSSFLTNHQTMQQQSNLSGMHQPQLGSQINVSGLQKLMKQQQLLGAQSGNSSMQSNLSDGAQVNAEADYHAKLSSIFVRYQAELTQLIAEARSSSASTCNKG